MQARPFSEPSCLSETPHPGTSWAGLPMSPLFSFHPASPPPPCLSPCSSPGFFPRVPWQHTRLPSSSPEANLSARPCDPPKAKFPSCVLQPSPGPSTFQGAARPLSRALWPLELCSRASSTSSTLLPSTQTPRACPGCARATCVGRTLPEAGFCVRPLLSTVAGSARFS